MHPALSEVGPVTTAVADLLAIDDLSLTLVAGKEGLGRSIRWAHVSELEDPTPFLRGGEVLLTTGLRLEGSTPQVQAGFIGKLAAAKLAGLGLGLGSASTPPRRP